MNPTFHHAVLKSFIPTFVAKTERTLDLWSETEGPIDARSFLRNMTIDILGQTVFGIDFGSLEGKQHEYLNYYVTFVEHIGSMWRRLIPGYSYLPTKANRDFA